jgi:uncharacterized membrane protein
MVTSKGVSPRTIVKLTVVPFSPLISLTASVIVMSKALSSLILAIISFGLSPAFSAGNPSSGEIIIIFSSSSLPKPVPMP